MKTSHKNNLISRISSISKKGEAILSDHSFLPESKLSLKELFLQRYTESGGIIHEIQDDSGIREILARLIREEKPSGIYYGGISGLSQDLHTWLQLRNSWINIDPLSWEERKRVSAASEVGIFPCRYLLAETGSIVHFASRETDRLTTILPLKLWVIARKNQILKGWESLFDLIPDNFSQNIFVTTGPSRTADIEKKLIIGMHGPKEVRLLLIN